MDYQKVIQTINILTQRGWTSQQIGEADGYPLFALSNDLHELSPSQALPNVLMGAGIHGEEPGAVEGLLLWLREYAAPWQQRIRFTIFPCLNPWGYERGIRYAADGKDLNRQFDQARHPAVVAFHRLVANQQFDLFVDLHEDCDFSRMYLYESMVSGLDPDGPTLGRRILERVRPLVELSDQEWAEDMETKDGMIHVPLTREAAGEFENTPIALYVYAHHAPHTVTIETPGLLELEKRAALHVEAIEEACLYVTE